MIIIIFKILILIFIAIIFIKRKLNKRNIKANLIVGNIIIKQYYLRSFNDTDEIKLSETESIFIEGKDYKIRIKSSPCSDKICVNTVWLSKSGDYSFCSHLKIRLEID